MSGIPTQIVRTALKSLVLFVLGIVCTYNTSFSRNNSEIFRHLDLDKFGITTISFLSWDEHGMLWALSNKGIVQFNGYDIEFIEGTEQEPNRFLEKEIVNIQKVADDELWIFYMSGGDFTRFSPSTRTFTDFKADTAGTKKIPNEFWTSIVKHSNDTYFLGAWSGGFYKFDAQDKVCSKIGLPYESLRDTSVDYNKANIKALTQLSDGRILIGLFNETYCGDAWPVIYDPIKNKFEKIDFSEAVANNGEGEYAFRTSNALEILHFAHEDKNGNIWFGSYSALIFWDKKKNIAKRILTDEKLGKQNDFNASQFTENGDYLWVGSSTGGIFKVNINTLEGRQIRSDVDVENALTDNRIYALQTDNFENIWIATPSGIDIYLHEMQQFRLMDWNYLNLEYSNASLQVTPLNDIKVKDSLLLMSDVQGIHSYNIYTGRQSLDSWYAPYPAPKNFILSWVFQFKLTDSLLIGSIFNVPLVYDFKNQEFLVGEGGSSLGFFDSRMIFENIDDAPIVFVDDDPGALEVGLIEANITTREIATIYKNDDGAIVSEYSFILPSGNWLISERFGRFLIYDPKKKSHKLYSPSREDSYFPDTTINCAIQFGDSVYFGTDYGLYGFTEDGGVSKLLNDRYGLKEREVIKALYRYPNGSIWIATIDELIYYDSRSMASERYGEAHGLRVTEFMPGTGIRDELGNMYFECTDGLITFNPKEIKRQNSKYTVQVSKVFVNDSLLSSDVFDELIGGKHSFDWTQNYLTFDFYSDRIITAVPHEFEYRLIGQSEKWIYNGTSHSVRLADLYYGDYELQVRIVENGIVKSNVLSIPFTIEHPYYLSLWFYILIGVLLSALVFLYVKQREKVLKKRSVVLEGIVQQRTQEIRLQKEEIEIQKFEADRQRELVEEKQKEITDSIAYAKRIQEAILPSDQFFKSHLPNSFIFYRPKDIVAGDFYWMYEKDKQVFFAAADCTGHGVPGAMVSVVCNNALNRAMREFNLSDPGEILDKTREIVIEQLNESRIIEQDHFQLDIKDGMDISLCVLDKSNFTLKWAGANNSVWIIRKGEILHRKGDKQPVGKHEPSTPFTTHSIQIMKDDSLYIFSDGYADQFGGEKGKKYKTKNFIALLQSIADKDMSIQQERISKNFDEWKDGYEQVDDVCVIGVRL